MPYLTFHIALIGLGLLIAAIIGGFIGWWLRNRKAEAVEAQLLSNLEQEVATRKELNAKVQQLETALETKGRNKTPRRSEAATSRQPTNGGRDDLKEIRGIGPVLEQKLNDMGITTFYQVAKLSDVEIDSIAAQLSTFPNRIRRDDWTRGASEQYQKAHGELKL
jgi:predicted flap endonuclease-1-like 5' DNA nuclease